MRKKTATRDIRLIHGPMLGDLTADGCTVWMRTADASAIRIVVSTGDTSHSFTGVTSPEDDYTGTVRVTNVHTHPVIKEALFGYNEKCSFGHMRFDFTEDDPTATYTIFNIDDEKIWEMTLGLKKDLSFK
ncbi:MAG: hypothetical protein ACI9TH_002499 [Kiritimatiellia bacterium]|jgi:hypothetical protein